MCAHNIVFIIYSFYKRDEKSILWYRMHNMMLFMFAQKTF